MKAVLVDNVSRAYGKIQALSGVSFEVNRGEIFGLIGADGAGKTTLFRIMTTLLLADAGTVTVDSFDVVKGYREIRRRVGYMPGKFSLYGDLTVEENLNFFASVFGTTINENRHLIEDIYQQIEPFKKRRAAKLSGGMKQKLALCCALIHAPSVLFLDEPTTGVDPVSRREFWEMLQRLKKAGITIIVSTPYMDEARMCDRMAFIREGRVLSIDTPQNIIDHYDGKLYAVKAHQMHQLLDAVRQYEGVESCYAFGEYHHFTTHTPDFNAEKLLAYLTQEKFDNITITQIRPTIEDCYMKLSKQ